MPATQQTLISINGITGAVHASVLRRHQLPAAVRPDVRRRPRVRGWRRWHRVRERQRRLRQRRLRRAGFRFSTINHYRNLGWTRYKALETRLATGRASPRRLVLHAGEIDLELLDHHHRRCRDEPARPERRRRARQRRSAPQRRAERLVRVAAAIQVSGIYTYRSALPYPSRPPASSMPTASPIGPSRGTPPRHTDQESGFASEQDHQPAEEHARLGVLGSCSTPSTRSTSRPTRGACRRPISGCPWRRCPAAVTARHQVRF